MARKITIFELYFEGAQFGPTVGDSPEKDDEWTDAEESYEEYDEKAAGRSRVRPALAAVGAVAAVSTVGYLAARRFRGGDEDYEFDESEPVEFDESEYSEEPVTE
ncbi:MAG: hypothetical protein V5A28_11015 [Haloarculaceae archaeon]